MIKFRDFKPTDTTKFLDLQRSQTSLDDMVAAANRWINQAKCEVVSIETLILPDLSEKAPEESARPVFEEPGFLAKRWCQIVRIWYRER
jgi:hypothetical protein